MQASRVVTMNMLMLSVLLAGSTVFMNLANYNHNAIAAEPDFVTLEQMTKQHSTTVNMVVPSILPSGVPVDVTLKFENQNNTSESLIPLENSAYDFRVIQNGNATYQQVGSIVHSHDGGVEATVTPTFDKGPATIIVVLNPPPTSASNETGIRDLSMPTAATDSAIFNVEVS
jgi:hypothetical protein